MLPGRGWIGHDGKRNEHRSLVWLLAWTLLPLNGLLVLADQNLKTPDPGVRRVAEIRGVVCDAKGQPIADAKVTIAEPTRRVETVTDEKGDFHLKDIAQVPSFLFVRKQGWRFHGQRYAANGTDPVKIVLEASDATPAAAFKVVQEQFPLAERRLQAIKLLEQTLDMKADVNQNRQEQQRMRTLQAWARIDPAAALAQLNARPFKQGLFGDIIRNAAKQALVPQDVEGALEIVETMSPGYGRAQSLTEISDSLPASERQRKLDLLADALVIFRAVKEPEMRLMGIAMTADRLIDLGEQARGEKLLRDDLATASQLGKAEFPGFARGIFAEKLGRIDPAAALDLIKDLKGNNEFNRHHGNLAHELAGTMPAEAEKVLDLIKPPEQNRYRERDMYGVRVCYRMASVDLHRAERIALSIVGLSERAHALGVMAEALAAQDGNRARQLLAQAYDVLDEADQKWDPENGPTHPAVIAGCLLSTVKKLDADPDRLPLLKECVWRTIRLVPPVTTDSNQSWFVVEGRSSVALWLAEFETSLAREVLFPVDKQRAQSSRTYAPALALVAMDRIDAFLEEIPDDYRDMVRMSAAAILPLDGAKLRRQIHRDTWIWPIDMEDIAW